jgi:Tol biopolymer transport system component
MSLEQQVRDVLAERAERSAVPLPDIHALTTGGLSRRRRRRTRLTMVSAAAAAVLVVAGGIVAWSAQNEDRSTNITNTPDQPKSVGKLYFLDLDTGERTPAADEFVSMDEVTFSPDGKRVACYGDCFGTSGFVVANADGSDLVELHSPPAVDNRGKALDGSEPDQVTWSPDGTTLLYTVVHGSPYSNIQDVFLHDTASDETSTLIDFGLQDRSYYGLAAGLDFSPDGSTVLYSLPRRPFACPEPNPEFPCAEHENWDLWSVPVTGGEPSPVLRNATLPAYLADGRSIAFAKPLYAAYGGSSIEIVTDGHRRTLAPAEAFDDFIWDLRPSPDRSKLLGSTGSGVYVVDVATGDVSHLYANQAVWAGDDRLLIGCIPNAPAPSEEPTVDTCS